MWRTILIIQRTIKVLHGTRDSITKPLYFKAYEKQEWYLKRLLSSEIDSCALLERCDVVLLCSEVCVCVCGGGFSGPLFFLFPWSPWWTHTHFCYGGLRDEQHRAGVSWTRALWPTPTGPGPEPGGGRGRGRWRIWTSEPGTFGSGVCGGEIPDRPEEAGAHAVRCVFDRWLYNLS